MEPGLRIIGFRTVKQGLVELLNFLDSKDNQTSLTVEDKDTCYERVGEHTEMFHAYRLTSAKAGEFRENEYVCEIQESDRKFSKEAYTKLMTLLTDIRVR